MQASKEAIPHFLAEMKRKTGSFTLDDLPKLNPEVRKCSNPIAGHALPAGHPATAMLDCLLDSLGAFLHFFHCLFCLREMQIYF